MFSSQPEFHTFSGSIQQTKHELYFLGDIKLKIIRKASGRMDESQLTDDGDRVLIEANETAVSRVDPWDLPDDTETVRDDATITIAHTGDDAYLVGKYGVFPAYHPFYIIHNESLYEVGSTFVSQSFEDELLDVDVPDGYTRVQNVTSGIAKPLQTDELTRLNEQDDLLGAIRISK